MRFELTFDLEGLPGMRPSEVLAEQTKTMIAIGQYWMDEFRPVHYTQEGARRYQMAPRRTKNIFTGQVKKRKGKAASPSPRPNYWTGETETESRRANVEATSRTVEVNMTLPRYINYRHKLSDPRLNIRRELTTVVNRERKELAEFGAQDLSKRFGGRTPRRRLRVA